MINFAGNDYLCLSQDSRVRDAFIKGAYEYGVGSTSSPLLSGYTRAHQELEERFATFLNRDRAIFFNSGYHANLGVLNVFANRSTPVIADKHCHASIIDAIILSRAPHHRYHHQDLTHAASIMQQYSDQASLIVTESVFSMTGAITQTNELCNSILTHHALLIIDDAHGFGILGQQGKGVCEQFGLSQENIPILITPLGKSLGCAGAIISGKSDIIEHILQKARTYCYSTALPPAICCAASQALTILSIESWRVHRIKELSEFFNREAAARYIDLISNDLTAIKCILSGTNTETIALQDFLKTQNIFASAIRPPTVPPNLARIRISLNLSHTENDILKLLNLMCEYLNI